MSVKPQKLSAFLRRCLEVVFLLGIPITLGTPFLLKDYYQIVFWMVSRQENSYFLIALLMVTGVLGLIILYEARQILLTVNQDNPFVWSNVRSLRRIALASLLIAGAYFIKSVVFPTFLTIVLSLMMLIIGLFVMVMAQLFQQAVAVKEENDLTV